MNCFKFYINKYAHLTKDIPDLSFVPMLMRRKLDPIGKAGLYTLYNSYIEGIEQNLVFASCYGDVERVLKLIEQRKAEGEISPTGFSFSVHNATVGLFSLLNKIKSSYNSISAGKNTLNYGILEAILTSKDNPTLFCYAESYKELKSVSFSCSQNALTENAFEVEIEIKKQEKESFDDDFIKFLNGEIKEYCTDLYKLTRC